MKNPAYAGFYAFGRFRCRKQISSEGQIQSKITAVPMSSWTVTIPDHHEAYITWEEFLQNQTTLLCNLTCVEENILTGPAREGLALLQGLLLCGNCGRRLTIRYQGNGGIYPTYECNWLRREGLATRSCLHVRCSILDDAVSARLLQVIHPAQLQIALEALRELEQRDQALSHQWRMRIERAEYVVYYWIERGLVEARRLNAGSPYWITLCALKEQELLAWVQRSIRIQSGNRGHSEAAL